MATGGRIPLRVLQVIHGFNTGGAETLVKEYLILMQGTDIESRAVCFERLGSSYEHQLEEAGIRVIYLDDARPSWLRKSKLLGRLLGWCYYTKALRRVLYDWQPDAVHTHLLMNRYMLSVLGRHVHIGHGGKPMVLFHTVHSEPRELWFPESVGLKTAINRRRDFYAACRLVRHRGMHVIALHDDMRRELNALFRITKTLVINNGVDFARFHSARPREQVREELGVSCDFFVVGHVGRFASVKNHEKIVSVFAEVCRRRSDAFLLLVGSGELREKVERDLESRGIAERSRILSDRTDVPDLMGCMDVFLFPSLYEGLPLTLVEAQVSRLPCVVSDVVSRHAVLSNLVRMRSASDSDDVWADDVLTPFPKDVEYYGIEDWDLRNVVRDLERLYRSEETIDG